MKLTLKPFGPVDGGVLGYLRAELGEFGDVTLEPPTMVPPAALSPDRGQYHVAPFLEACANSPGDRVLGVTGVDLYEEDTPFRFGVGRTMDRLSLISTARLSGDGAEKLRERALKEAVHELGHTLGLNFHDDDPGCVMHFSETVADTDRKGRSFCPRCRPQVLFTLKRLRT